MTLNDLKNNLVHLNLTGKELNYAEMLLEAAYEMGRGEAMRESVEKMDRAIKNHTQK